MFVHPKFDFCMHTVVRPFANSLGMLDYHGELDLGSHDTDEPALRVVWARKAPCTATSTQMYMIDTNARYAVKRKELIRFKNCSGSISNAPIHLMMVRPSTSSANTDFGSARCMTSTDGKRIGANEQTHFRTNRI